MSTFLRGVSSYELDGRLEYCDFVGLTPTMLRDLTSISTVFTIIHNLDLSVPPELQATIDSIQELEGLDDIGGLSDEQRQAIDKCKRMIYTFMCFGHTSRSKKEGERAEHK